MRRVGRHLSCCCCCCSNQPDWTGNTGQLYHQNCHLPQVIRPTMCEIGQRATSSHQYWSPECFFPCSQKTVLGAFIAGTGLHAHLWRLWWCRSRFWLWKLWGQAVTGQCCTSPWNELAPCKQLSLKSLQLHIKSEKQGQAFSASNMLTCCSMECAPLTS